MSAGAAATATAVAALTRLRFANLWTPLSVPMLDVLEGLRFEFCTPVQAEVIPELLSFKDGRSPVRRLDHLLPARRGPFHIYEVQGIPQQGSSTVQAQKEIP